MPPKLFLIVLLMMAGAFSLKAQTISSPLTDTAVYRTVEHPAGFPGGDAGLIKYIIENTKYTGPKEGEQIQSSITLLFIVEKNGSLSNLKILKSKKTSLETELIRTIKTSPKWQPAMQNGKTVRYQYRLPVSCLLFASE